MIMGAVSSATALSVNQVAHDKGVVYMVTGGHTDPVTGSQCHWTTFRICTTTYMLAAGLASTLYKKFGGKWYFITPDYAFGHTLQEAYAKILKGLGGTVLGNSLSPLGTTDFSSYLIKAQSTNPNVLILLVDGQDLVNCVKQAVQFGLQKKFPMGGGLSELEVLAALPPTSASAGGRSNGGGTSRTHRTSRSGSTSTARPTTTTPTRARAPGSATPGCMRSHSAPTRRRASSRPSTRARWKAWRCRRRSRCNRTTCISARATTS